MYEELANDLRASITALDQRSVSAHGFNLLVGSTAHVAAARRAQARTVLSAEDVLHEIAELHRGETVLMKGLEVAQLYPSPVMRGFRDVDVLCTDAAGVWSALTQRGYRHRATRRVDIDHHHLPAMASPRGRVGVEVHVRPNTPAWARFPTSLLFDTAEPSRTGIDGVMRPRDDLHALLMALHCWKGGFTRLRDAYDAILLASLSDHSVDQTAAELGLLSCWRWTVRFAETELLQRGSPIAQIAARAVLPRDDGLAGRRRARLTAPFLCANPVRVMRSHVSEYRLGRQARQPSEDSTP